MIHRDQTEKRGFSPFYVRKNTLKNSPKPKRMSIPCISYQNMLPRRAAADYTSNEQ